MAGKTKFLVFTLLFFGAFLISASGVIFHTNKTAFGAAGTSGCPPVTECTEPDPSGNYTCTGACSPGGGGDSRADAVCLDGATYCGFTDVYSKFVFCKTTTTGAQPGGSTYPNNVCSASAQFPVGTFDFTDIDSLMYTGRVFSGTGTVQMYPVDDNGYANLVKNSTDWQYNYNGCQCGPDSTSGNGCGGNGSGSGLQNVSNIEEGATLTVSATNMCKASHAGAWGVGSANAVSVSTNCLKDAREALGPWNGTAPTHPHPEGGSYVPDSRGRCKYVPPATQFSCTGTDPSNATFCSGSDSGLTGPTPKQTYSSCGANKCAYTCNAGYESSGGLCIPKCLGAPPTPNSSLCPGANLQLGSPTNIPAVLLSSCANPAALCSYQCDSGWNYTPPTGGMGGVYPTCTQAVATGTVNINPTYDDGSSCATNWRVTHPSGGTDTATTDYRTFSGVSIGNYTLEALDSSAYLVNPSGGGLQKSLTLTLAANGAITFNINCGAKPGTITVSAKYSDDSSCLASWTLTGAVSKTGTISSGATYTDMPAGESYTLVATGPAGATVVAPNSKFLTSGATADFAINCGIKLPTNHFACLNGSCTVKLGATTDTDGCTGANTPASCTSVGGTQYYHCSVTAGNSCVLSAVGDTNPWQYTTSNCDNACGPGSNWHLGCQNNSCAWISGGGPNIDGCNTANQSCTNKYSCQNNSCVSDSNGAYTGLASCQSAGCGNPPLACSPPSQTITAAGTASFSATGGTTPYSWTGGGAPATGNGANFNSTFNTPGIKTVTVSDSSSQINNAFCSVTVQCPSGTIQNGNQCVTVPVSCTGPTSGTTGQSLSFAAVNGSGSYSWSGGGTPSTGSGAGFTTSFSTTGNKSVSVADGLTTSVCSVNITSGTGCSGSETNPHSSCVSGSCTVSNTCGTTDCSACGGTLSVSLSANPSSGPASLTSTLTAPVSGSAGGTINYKFWKDCNNSTTVLATAISACGQPTAYDGSSNNSQTNPFTYASAGTYYPKVLVERGSAPNAEARTTVTVMGVNSCQNPSYPSGATVCTAPPPTNNTTPWTQVTSCNGVACTYTGGTGFSCTGSIPSGSSACSGTGTGLTQNRAYTGVASCSANQTDKCEYTPISCSVSGETNPHSSCVSGSCTVSNTCGTTDCSACGGTLSVSLSANPSSGPASLTSTLTALVSGTEGGTINYKFWKDCNNSTTVLATAISVCGEPTAYDGSSNNSQTNPFTYASAGTYYPKVLVERGSAPNAEARTTVTVIISGMCQLTFTPVQNTVANPPGTATYTINALTGTPANSVLSTANFSESWVSSGGFTKSNISEGQSSVLTVSVDSSAPASGSATFNIVCNGDNYPQTVIAGSVVTHAECSASGSCVDVAGAGANNCDACSGYNTCENISGAGVCKHNNGWTSTDECTFAGSSCANYPDYLLKLDPVSQSTPRGTQVSFAVTALNTNPNKNFFANNWVNLSQSGLAATKFTTSWSRDNISMANSPVYLRATPKAAAPLQPYPFSVYGVSQNNNVQHSVSGNLIVTATGSVAALYFSVDPSSGASPLSSVLTATITSSLVAPTNYTFWWNCAYAGTSVSATTAACGNPQDSTKGAKFDGVAANSQQTSHVYTADSTAKVITAHGTEIFEARVPVTVTIDSVLLAVSLSANPSSGSVPLASTLTATVSGSATGTINYKFWKSCSNPTISLASAISACGQPTAYDGSSNNPQTNPFTYASVGTYYPKVLVERGSAPNAQAITTVTVTSACSVGQTNPHSTCVSGSCTASNGCGTTDCTACGGSHLECQGLSCVSVPGSGGNLNGCTSAGQSCSSGYSCTNLPSGSSPCPGTGSGLTTNKDYVDSATCVTPQPANECHSHPGNNYSCISGSCSVNPSGDYSSSASCQAACGGGSCSGGQTNPYYTCSGNACTRVSACGSNSNGCNSGNVGSSCGGGCSVSGQTNPYYACSNYTCTQFSVCGVNSNGCTGGTGSCSGICQGSLPSGATVCTATPPPDNVTLWNQVATCGSAACTYTGGSSQNTCTLTASPSIVSKGGSSKLTWYCGSGVSSPCTLTTQGSVGTSGNANVKPTTSTKYTLSCAGGSVTADVSVKVMCIQECNPNDPTCKPTGPC